MVGWGGVGEVVRWRGSHGGVGWRGWVGWSGCAGTWVGGRWVGGLHASTFATSTRPVLCTNTRPPRASTPLPPTPPSHTWCAVALQHAGADPEGQTVYSLLAGMDLAHAGEVRPRVQPCTAPVPRWGVLGCPRRAGIGLTHPTALRATPPAHAVFPSPCFLPLAHRCTWRSSSRLPWIKGACSPPRPSTASLVRGGGACPTVPPPFPVHSSTHPPPHAQCS